MKTIRRKFLSDPPENYTGKIIFEDYLECYYKNGQYHREDGPAIDNTRDGLQRWYLNGKRHREDGPAFTYLGVEEWFFNDLQHRVDGPAVIDSTGFYLWCYMGKPHRLDGPARGGDGELTEWYLFGREFSKEKHKALVEKIQELRAGNPNLSVKAAFDIVRSTPPKKKNP